ncbi:MAG: acyl-CoA carboxylase epsilon subunit, partial [Pseudonocardiaceae bacterium]
MLRIVRGEPSDEELAALILVLAALPNAGAEPPAPRSAWA